MTIWRYRNAHSSSSLRPTFWSVSYEGRWWRPGDMANRPRKLRWLWEITPNAGAAATALDRSLVPHRTTCEAGR